MKSRLKRLSKMRKGLGRTSTHLSTMSRRRWTCTMMNKTTTSRTNKTRANQIKMSREKPLSQLSQSMRPRELMRTKRS